MAGIFSRFIFNNAIFNTDGGQNPDTHDGADADTYKRYRKRLERVAKAAEKFNQSKYIKEAVKVLEIAEDTPIDTPVIREIAEAVQARQTIPDIDLSALQNELKRLILYIDAFNRAKMQELEDEFIILMCV